MIAETRSQIFNTKHLSSYAHVVHRDTTAQVNSRRGKNENVCEKF